MREIIKMIVVLSAICGLSGFGLSYLKQLTAPAIENQVLTYVQGPAIKQVLTGTDNDPIADRKKFTNPVTGKEINVFPALKDGKLVAIALEDFGGGFGGDIGVIVGFNVENDTLTGIGVTTMKETPGLGTVVADPRFTKQFKKQPMVVELKSKGGQIDALSGATISSTGVVTAVQNAAKVYQAIKSEATGTWK
ncbi:RnfABCDGE type electron transport complex subunit G [Desulfovibrio mangrovi]|uniref:RnfABCDGE type electron transport complex subunit G n=1 Tax=Desulfovibrio mangrovi TaxID=2976983 RepID=UPI00224588E6|nr:RnfABCDGE type electron transport complex subunit G [Desulfovibrio mangrovi]UZP66836.1 RnfABCDGE type electron transport complex subunit G [Desulfovibrio mangrovi]